MAESDEGGAGGENGAEGGLHNGAGVKGRRSPGLSTPRAGVLEEACEGSSVDGFDDAPIISSSRGARANPDGDKSSDAENPASLKSRSENLSTPRNYYA